MGILIKEMLGVASLHTLTSNFDPGAIRQEQVAQVARKLVKTIKSLELYPSHQALIDRFQPLREKYPAIYAHRTRYIWQVSQAIFQFMSLNLSDKDFLESNLLKCQGSFISVLFDDLCDLGGDKAGFDKFVLALKGEIDQNEIELYTLVADTWSVLQSDIARAPNYPLLKPALEEAYRLWIASFEYSLSLEQGLSVSKVEWERYIEIIPHTSMFYWAGLVDLLFVPNLLASQVSSTAEVFLRTQKMVQIANWATSWTREIAQHDFTSGVFRLALEKGWIGWDELNKASSEEIKQKIHNSPAQDYLWNIYEQLRVEAHQIVQETRLPALDGYLEGASPVMFILVASAEEFSNY